MIAANAERIRERISTVCRKTGRNPSEITLLAVGKTFPADNIREALHAGIIDIGENYVQELLEKKKLIPQEDVRWHFIGHLQSNKVKYISDWISLIHAVDNLSLAREIERRAEHSSRVIDVLVEVNTTGETSKFGIQPSDTVEFVRSLAPLRNIRIAGLMTIGPFLPDPEGSRPMFRQLRNLRDEVGHLGQENVTMKHLSMGMTGDFEVGIEEGATIVRIGTALFGHRKRKDA
jgi:hypothetical protein